MSGVSLSTGLMAVTALLVMGCSDSAGPATVTLTSVNPLPAATAVAPSTSITLGFSHPMMAGMEQYVDLHQGGVDGPVIPMGCAWNPDRTTLGCTPAGPLAPGTDYTIHVGAGMRDDHGEMIDLDPWVTEGCEWATGGMMGGTHAGQPVGMMGPGWKDGTHYGMLFSFTTG